MTTADINDFNQKKQCSYEQARYSVGSATHLMLAHDINYNHRKKLFRVSIRLSNFLERDSELFTNLGTRFLTVQLRPKGSG